MIIWEAVERLQHLGFKVLVVSGDGASTNQKFMRMDEDKSCSPYNPVYKTENLYSSEKRHLYFMSDVPHYFDKDD